MKAKNRFRSIIRHPNAPSANRSLTREEKLREAAPRGIEIASRVSSDQQAENEGSFLVQEQRTLRWLRALGIDTSNARTTRIIETGRDGADRGQFDALVDRIVAGLIGILMVGYGSRLARNMHDGLRLVEAASERRTMVVVGERILDPRNPHDRSEILRQILDAELENSMRALHTSDAREELARELKYRRRLPVGLVWASAEDETYRAMARRAGLGWCLESERLERDKTQVTRHGMRLYVLPDPHPDVYCSLRMILNWLLETEDPTEVYNRIMSHPGYPRRGQVPTSRVHTFNPGVPPLWRPVDKTWLKGWLRSEALYGFYSYRSVALAKYGQDECPHFLVEDAFPSFLTADDVERINEIYANPKRKWRHGSYSGPRNHALVSVKCAEIRPDGRPCGRNCTPVYSSDGSYTYHSGICRIIDRHQGRIPVRVEELVFEILRRAFTPGHLRELEEVLSTQLRAHRARIERLEADKKRLTGRVDAAMGSEADARAAHDIAEEREWARKRKEWTEQLRAAERELDAIRQEGERLERLTADQIAVLCAAAGDVARLIDECRDAERNGSEGLRRRLVRALVRAIHVRRLIESVYEVSVEFPSGARVTGIATSAKQKPSAAEQLYIADRLAAGHTPYEIAEDLTRARRIFGSKTAGGAYRAGWDAEAVIGVDLVHDSPRVVERLGTYLSLDEFAGRACEPVERVLAAALADVLGPIRICDGEILVCPEPGEVERAFPTTARERIAAEQGCDVADIVPLVEVVRETGKSRDWVENRAKSRGALCRTAAGRYFVRRSVLIEEDGPRSG